MRLGPVAAICVAAGALLGCARERPRSDFAALFGPQATAGPVEERKLAEYDVALSVVDGSTAFLEESPNPVLTCRDGRLAVDAPVPKAGRRYVYARLQLRSATGWRIYACTARISSGPLRGAMVTVCAPEEAPQPSITAPYQACYALPATLEVTPGPLTCDVVRFFGK